MLQRDRTHNVAPHLGMIPVVIPATLLLFLAGAARTYHFLTQTPGAYSHSTAKEVLHKNQYNPTEETFANYVAVLGRLPQTDSPPLSREEQRALLAQIGALKREPICMDGDTFHNQKISEFSPQTVLLSLSQTLALRAQSAAKRGDPALAKEYIGAIYGIGEHILSATNPSVKGLESAHHFLGFAARIQETVSPENEHVGSDARYRASALSTLWKERIFPRLPRNHSTADSDESKRLVAILAEEYREGWSRIRGEEA